MILSRDWAVSSAAFRSFSLPVCLAMTTTWAWFTCANSRKSFLRAAYFSWRMMLSARTSSSWRLVVSFLLDRASTSFSSFCLVVMPSATLSRSSLFVVSSSFTRTDAAWYCVFSLSMPACSTCSLAFREAIFWLWPFRSIFSPLVFLFSSLRELPITSFVFFLVAQNHPRAKFTRKPVTHIVYCHVQYTVWFSRKPETRGTSALAAREICLV
mmetsp:Transcript_9826/g.20472  ORF Transcript_9826/g.20472 Transcript_9826/m.20472 type:complete len:212 (+) Transcript_9826:1986-2621(+)